MRLYRFMEIKKQRLQGQDREMPSASSNWGFWAQLQWMVRETIPVCSLYRAPTAAAAGGRELGWVTHCSVPSRHFCPQWPSFAGCSSPHHSMSTAPGPQETHPHCWVEQESLVCLSRGGWTIVIIHAPAAALSVSPELSQVRCFFSLCCPSHPTLCSLSPVCHSQ